MIDGFNTRAFAPFVNGRASVALPRLFELHPIVSAFVVLTPSIVDPRIGKKLFPRSDLWKLKLRAAFAKCAITAARCCFLGALNFAKGYGCGILTHNVLAPSNIARRFQARDRQHSHCPLRAL